MSDPILPPNSTREQEYAVSPIAPAKWLLPDGSVVSSVPVSGSTAAVSYNFIQSDEDVTYKYYGFLSSVGWQFKRKTLATGIWHVASGTGDYDTAWSDRANKDYAYL